MLNRAVLVTAVVALSLGTAAAAMGQGSRTGVGAQVGYSRTDLAGANAELITPRQGALTGVYLYAPLTRLLSLRPELLFALKGGRTTTDDGLDIDIELAYLEFPLLARVTVPGGRFRPVFFGGPAPALQIGCDFQFILPDQPERPVRVTCGDDPVTIVRELDWGIVGGAGIEGRWPQAALSLEARYTAGLRSVFDDVEIRNRAVSVLLGITF
ncbi:MAG: PorT family protein [Gemmatimonadales bacterium]|nr:PorT family protein [Gemmatimonadales bacterium]